MARTPYGALAAALLGWLAAVAPASAAVPPVIKDEAKFFSDKARTEADAKIKEIYRETGKDLLIETFPSVPADKAKGDLKDREARNRFFEEIVNGEPDPVELLRRGDEAAVRDLIAAARRSHQPA